MPQTLLRLLGLAFGLAVLVGNTIGGGILRTPGDIAAWLPSPWAFVGIWIVGALYAFLGANALAELGTMLPRSGGQYQFARYAFGDYPGFLVGWVDWISVSAGTAVIALVLAESIGALFKFPKQIANLPAIAIVALFSLVLVRGTRFGDTAQRTTTALKAVALLVLVIVCFTFGGAPHSADRTAPITGAATGFTAFILALQAVIYTFDGWTAPFYFSEELREPAREIPRTMFYGLASVAIVYVLINAAFAHALPIRELAGSQLAAATVARTIFGDRGDTLVRIIVVASLPSAVNACLLISSRVLFAMGRDRLAPTVAGRLTSSGTPVVALLASGAVSIAFLATGTFESMVAIAAFFYVAQYSLSFASLFVLRRREPQALRPYMAIGHPWTTAFVLLGSLTFLVGAVISDRRNSVYALAIVIVSYPLFRITRMLSRIRTEPYVSARE